MNGKGFKEESPDYRRGDILPKHDFPIWWGLIIIGALILVSFPILKNVGIKSNEPQIKLLNESILYNCGEIFKVSSIVSNPTTKPIILNITLNYNKDYFEVSESQKTMTLFVSGMQQIDFIFRNINCGLITTNYTISISNLNSILDKKQGNLTLKRLLRQKENGLCINNCCKNRLTIIKNYLLKHLLKQQLEEGGGK